MPDLTHCLHSQDLGFLNIVAELWGLDIEAPDTRSFRKILLTSMRDKALFEEVVSVLPKSVTQALVVLMGYKGKMPWTQFKRLFGDLRMLGSIKRDKEKPYRTPSSAAEFLWYRALVGKDFLDFEDKVQECAYIPDEFMAWLPEEDIEPFKPIIGKPIELAENDIILLGNDQILDQVCVLLSALRRSQPVSLQNTENWTLSQDHLLTLLRSLLLVNQDGIPAVEYARPWLESSRGEALLFLINGWLKSDSFNELRLVPSLLCEGVWINDPIKARFALLDFIKPLPYGQWCNLDAFIEDIHSIYPDFMRNNGEYDTWLIRSSETDGFLIGQPFWQDVEGALIRFFITGPMHALGLTDLIQSPHHGRIIAFRRSEWFDSLILEGKPVDLKDENAPVLISSSGLIELSRYTQRMIRYQISRFCEWISERDGLYRYRLTPKSLKAAGEQGLRPAHLISLLRKHGKSPPSPSLVRAILRWEEEGREAFIEPVHILRVASPEILTALRQSPANRFLGDPLGPVTIIVKEEGIDKVMAALVRLGYLTDGRK